MGFELNFWNLISILISILIGVSGIFLQIYNVHNPDRLKSIIQNVINSRKVIKWSTYIFLTIVANLYIIGSFIFLLKITETVDILLAVLLGLIILWAIIGLSLPIITAQKSGMIGLKILLIHLMWFYG
jgi:hypothetical protein